MAAKMVAISARILHEDAEFISSLDIEGAVTPSDKLRAIVADARRRRSGMRDYRSAVEEVQDLLAQTSNQVRQIELDQRTHSELVKRVIEWLPDTMAFLVSSSAPLSGGEAIAELANLEDGLADRVFRLMESVLQLGVTRRSACYRSSLITERVEPILELADVITKLRASQQKEQQS